MQHSSTTKPHALAYPYKVERDDDGSFIVQFLDIPEAHTPGDTREEAEAGAFDCLLTALGAYIHLGRPVPWPRSRRRGDGQVMLDPGVVAALRRYDEAREDAIDVLDSTRSQALVDSGKMEVFPAELVYRLDGTESPVRVFREHRGMTQAELAAAIGEAEVFVATIESGAKHPTAEELERLARALKIDIELLLPDA